MLKNQMNRKPLILGEETNKKLDFYFSLEQMPTDAFSDVIEEIVAAHNANFGEDETRMLCRPETVKISTHRNLLRLENEGGYFFHYVK